MAKSGFALQLALRWQNSDLRPVLADCMITSDNLASKPAISSEP